MSLQSQVLTLPIRSLPHTQPAAADWHQRWHYEAEAFTRSLGPRQGVYRLQLDRKAGTVTVDFDPERFSLDQLKGLGRDLGLLVGGAVFHTVLDLPQCGRRTALALELERQLQQVPGVARAAINPGGRTLTIEYVATAPAAQATVLDRARALGYTVRDFRLPPGWWERNQLAVYTAACLALLVAGWGVQRAGVATWLWGALAAGAYLAGGGVAALNGLRSLPR